jgi:serine/threonine protein kinase
MSHTPCANNTPPCIPHPQVVICDFGQAHTNSTPAAMQPSTKPSCTQKYTSPERSQPPQSFAPSFEDDVFAFGIVMSFIATSETPFPRIPPARLLDAIRGGARPDRELDAWTLHGAPEELRARKSYVELAKECWRHSPETRPNFEDILLQLTSLRQSVELAGR